MATHTVTRSYKDTSSNVISTQETPTGDTEINVSKTLTAGTNQELDVAFTVAHLQSVMFSTTTACTIYTNAASGSSPQDTIPLVAGQTYIWTLATDGSGKIPFAGNVTKLYVTNAATTLLNIRSLVNQFV